MNLINISSPDGFVSRKPHRKTRSGCRVCKRRKIKCDEHQPRCLNCIKHGVQCDYSQTQTAASTGRNSASSNYNGVSSDIATSNPSNSPTINLPLVLPTLNTSDLELLHNYCNVTANTLQHDALLRLVMKINVPEVGFQNEYVLRGILAVSSIHMSKLKPERAPYFRSLAAQHHQMGLLIATPLLMNLSEENVLALYIFSTLTLYYTLACPRKPGDILVPGYHDTTNWMSLLKGTAFIFREGLTRLAAGPLGPILKSGRSRSLARDAYIAVIPPSEDPFIALCEFINHQDITPELKTIYATAIDGLRKTYGFIINHLHSLQYSDIFVWMFRLQDEFLELLRQNVPEALVIYAFSAVILDHMNDSWWVSGWPVQMISTIYDLLDEKFHKWIEWPMKKVGWAPPSKKLQQN